MNRKICGTALMFLLLVLSTASVVLADDLGMSKELPPGIKVAVPSSVERIVGNTGAEALCSSMWWQGTSNFIGSGLPDGDHYSRSRDSNNHSYACDIDKIGARGRFWSDNAIRDDTGMKYVYNSADKRVYSDNGGGDTCNYNYIYIRGNHHFEDAGQTTWTPETSNSC